MKSLFHREHVSKRRKKIRQSWLPKAIENHQSRQKPNKKLIGKAEDEISNRGLEGTDIPGSLDDDVHA